MNPKHNHFDFPPVSQERVDSLVHKIEHLREALEFYKLNFKRSNSNHEEGTEAVNRAGDLRCGLKR